MAPIRVTHAPRTTHLAAAALQIFALANAKDPCACLNWKEVYKTDMALCGEALEYHIATWGVGLKRREAVNAFAFAGDNAKACPEFFKKLDSDHCVNVGPYARGTADWTGMTWCYVSKECDDLYGGRRLADNQQGWTDWVVNHINDARLAKVSEVSWKLCRPGKDKQLRDMDPEDLLQLCERQQLSLLFCVKLAYTGAWSNFFWPHIHNMWEARGDPEIFRQLPELLQDAINKEEPIVVDTVGGGWYSDLVVSRGQDAFYLQYNPHDCPTTQYCRFMLETPAGEQEPAAASQEAQEPAAAAPQEPPAEPTQEPPTATPGAQSSARSDL